MTVRPKCGRSCRKEAKDPKQVCHRESTLAEQVKAHGGRRLRMRSINSFEFALKGFIAVVDTIEVGTWLNF